MSNSPQPQPHRVSTMRVFVVMAAVFCIGLALGLALYPFITLPTTIASLFSLLGAILIMISLLWERRA